MDSLGGCAGQLGEPSQTRGSFDEAEYGTSTTPAVDGIHFPVTDAISALDFGWPVLDAHSPLDSTATHTA